MRKNLFATTPGIIIVGAVIGLIAVWLQKLGNPANMGICVACFERDVAGGLGLHRAAIVQYLRPEIMGLVLGSLAAAIATREFKPRGGSAPIVRFVLGMIAAMGALVFLGCPWRAILFPVIAVCLLLLYLIFPQIPDQPQSGPLFYSVKGPGSQHAPFIASLGLAFIIGIFAQRSRFCTMGAFRDLFLFRYTHLFLGLAAMFAAAFIANALTGGLKFGFEGQPVAHSDFLWNYLGMVTAGLAFALAGGCPGRQLFMAGEGDSDAGIFALGMLVGAAMAHNLGTASSGTGIGVYGMQATIIGFAVCLIIGFVHSKKA